MADIYMTCCRGPGCPQIIGPLCKVEGPITPLIDRENTAWFAATYGKGIYMVKFCEGAWNYLNGWVVSRLPLDGIEWWNDGWFMEVVRAGDGKIYHFNEPVPPGTGYASHDLAEAAALAVAGKYNGGIEVWASCGDGDAFGVHYSDVYYPDDESSTGAVTRPSFSLYKLNMQPLRVVSTGIGFVDETHQAGVVTIENRAPAELEDVTFTLRATGGVSSPSDPVTVTFGPYLSTGYQQGVYFSYVVASKNTNATLTLEVSGALFDGDSLTLEVDLTPSIILNPDPVAGNVGDGSLRTTVRVQNVGMGPTYDLQGTVTVVSGAHLLDSDSGGGGIDASHYVESRLYDYGEILCGQLDNLGNHFRFVRADGATESTFDIAWADGAIVHPTSRITV